MATYAVRAFGADGQPTRYAFEAADPEAAILHASGRGDRPIMLYRLRDKPRPHFYRLWVAPHTPLPPVIRGRRALRMHGIWPCDASARQVRDAMRKWGIAGRVGWFSSEVESSSFIAASMRFLRGHMIESMFEKGEPGSALLRRASSRHEPHPRFEELPLIPVDPQLTVPIPSDSLLQSTIQGLPIRETGDEVTFLTDEMPAAEVRASWESFLGKKLLFGRASPDMEENRWIIRDIAARSFRGTLDDVFDPGFASLAWHLLSARLPGESDSGERWEEQDSKLPPLPVDSLDLYDSRLHEFIGETDLIKETITSDACAPVHTYLKLAFKEAIDSGAEGLRMRAEIDEMFVEYEYEGRWIGTHPAPLRLYAPALLVLCGAVGIPPDTLAPARSEFEFTARGVVHRFTALRTHDQWGERVEVVWDRVRKSVAGSS